VKKERKRLLMEKYAVRDFKVILTDIREQKKKGIKNVRAGEE